ncbi:MAG: hypothetical protein RIN55_05085 [Tissierellaceae bacterium]|nr:hypothetical protein [Tissierellaceae bacterium]
MNEENRNLTKIDKIVQKDYPFIGAIGTYLNFETEDMTSTEAELKAMKKKEENKDKKK